MVIPKFRGGHQGHHIVGKRQGRAGEVCCSWQCAPCSEPLVWPQQPAVDAYQCKRLQPGWGKMMWINSLSVWSPDIQNQSAAGLRSLRRLPGRIRPASPIFQRPRLHPSGLCAHMACFLLCLCVPFCLLCLIKIPIVRFQAHVGDPYDFSSRKCQSLSCVQVFVTL